jgi:hypothetical protein
VISAHNRPSYGRDLGPSITPSGEKRIIVCFDGELSFPWEKRPVIDQEFDEAGESTISHSSRLKVSA